MGALLLVGGTFFLLFFSLASAPALRPFLARHPLFSWVPWWPPANAFWRVWLTQWTKKLLPLHLMVYVAIPLLGKVRTWLRPVRPTSTAMLVTLLVYY